MIQIYGRHRPKFMSVVSFECDFCNANNQTLMYDYYSFDISIKLEHQYKNMY